MIFKYILKEHFKTFMLITFVGIAIYLLATLFERIDDFSEAGVGAIVTIKYLLLTLPEILSLILPAVFFLATVIVLCMMAKNKELQALQAGGITPFKLLKYMLIVATFWGVVQLFISQNVVIHTISMADEIWETQVHKRQPSTQELQKVWFADDNWIVYLEYLHGNGTGSNLIAYSMNENGSKINEIISGKEVSIQGDTWLLKDGVQSFPHKFEKSSFDELELPFKRNHSVLFLTEDSSTSTEDLPIQYLYYALQELVDSGSNVEGLETAIYAKIAYGASLLVLTFIAFALLSWNENVYICLAVGVLIVFIFYVCVMVGQTLGSSGTVAPLVAAWFPHIIFVILSFYRLFIVNYSNK